MQQALTNALLMDAVVGCLQSSKAVYAASKLAHFDREEGRYLSWFPDLGRLDSLCREGSYLCSQKHSSVYLETVDGMIGQDCVFL